MTGCSKSLAIFLKERHPESVEEMSNLADQLSKRMVILHLAKTFKFFRKTLLPKHREETTKVPLRRTNRDPIHNS